MHDIKVIRNNPEWFALQMRRRGFQANVDAIVKLDEEWRTLTGHMDQLRQTRNSVSKKIGKAKQDGINTTDLHTQMRLVGEGLKLGEEREKELSEQIDQILLTLPNIAAESTPNGTSSLDNVVARECGEKPKFDFKLLDHLALGEKLGILDFPRGGKITGSGFPVWVGLGASFERALINFMLDVQTKEHGYREMMTPLMGNRDSMRCSGQIPHLEDEMYHVEKDDLFLIPTSEVMLVNLHRDEIFNDSDLPVKYTAYTPCFRREAGSYGRETRGFLRTHQFNKVELVRFERPEESDKALEEILSHAESILKKLELPYRILQLCAGDMSFQAAACYDIEVWAPADGGRWLEVSSCSNCGDFQARRASIRYRPKEIGRAHV